MKVNSTNTDKRESISRAVKGQLIYNETVGYCLVMESALDVDPSFTLLVNVETGERTRLHMVAQVKTYPNASIILGL